MKIILGNPGSGKTKQILQLSAENNIPVLCESKARQERLLEKAYGYNITIPQPIVFDEVTPEVKEVYVDDIEKLLFAMLNVKIDTITVNTDKNTVVEKL